MDVEAQSDSGSKRNCFFFFFLAILFHRWCTDFILIFFFLYYFYFLKFLQETCLPLETKSNIIKKKWIASPQWLAVMGCGKSPNWVIHMWISRVDCICICSLRWEVLKLIIVAEKCFACCLTKLVCCHTCMWMFWSAWRDTGTKLIQRTPLFSLHSLPILVSKVLYLQ